MDRLLELRPFCESVAQINNAFQISDETWQQIEVFHKPLKFVAEKMVKMQTADLTLSDAYGHWIELREHLKCIERTPFVSTLLESMETRGSPLLNTTLMVTAVFLDPRFQLLLSEEEKHQAKRFLTELAKETMDPPDMPTHAPADTTTIDVETEILSPFECLLRERDAERIDNVAGNEAVNSELLDEIEKIQKLARLDKNTNIHTFWLNSRLEQPLLYYMATIMMSIPPTEVSCERNFSKLKFIMNRLRCSLSDEEIGKMLFLSLNAEFFDDL